MKKKILCVLISILLLVGLCMWNGTNLSAQEEQPETKKEVSDDVHANLALIAKKEYNFFFVCPIVGNPYWTSFERGIEAADQYYNVHTEVIGPEELSEEKRFSYFKQAVACKPDGIFLSAFSDPEYSAYVEKIEKTGIEIIYVECDVPEKQTIEALSDYEEDRISWIGSDNYEAGKLAAQAMRDGTQGTARIGILTAGMELDNIKQRVDGFISEIEKNPGMEIITIDSSDASLEKGMERIETMLDQEKLDAILGVSATDVIAAARVVQSRKLDDVILVGFDDLDATVQYIQSEVVYATIAQKTFDMGWLGVQVLIQTIQGEEIPGKKMNVEVTLLTKENVGTCFR